MELFFGIDFDGFAWPGPLAGKNAAFGSAWVGPNGLINILETQLGLTAPPESSSVRAAALVPHLLSHKGFWSESAAVDALGVARTLLHWRDHLVEAGWQGKAKQRRLADLAALATCMRPGRCDRLQGILEELEPSQLEIRCVHLAEAVETMTPLWQKLFGKLQQCGVALVPMNLPSCDAKGDLQSARASGFTPTGDGTLQLLRSHGPQQAAEAVAAWLSTQKSLEQTVLITPDPVLDGVLRQFGLPCTGATSTDATCNLLELLPLTLQLGWLPTDPQRALELLTLPVSPIPSVIRRRLIAALLQWPAVDSDAWREALKDGLTQISDIKDREKIALRLKSLVASTVSGNDYPVVELKTRTTALLGWLRGNLISEANVARANSFYAAVQQCEEFVRLLNAAAFPSLTRAGLQRLLAEVRRGIEGPASFPAEAGLHCVSAPGAVFGAVKAIIWWDFTLEAASSFRPLPLNPDELAELHEQGVRLPDPSREALQLNSRWMRPLQFATEKLLLVCPRKTADGDTQHPHPLWDQIAANAGKAPLLPLCVREPIYVKPPKMVKAEALPPPKPRTRWDLGKQLKISFREVESPSGAGSLVGCSFQWVLRYVGKVDSGDTAELPQAEQLVGNVAHEILARVLKSGISDPKQAGKAAEKLFDAEAPRLAASLFVPGAESLQLESRRATVRSAIALLEHLHKAKLSVASVETPLKVKALGAEFEGRADLVVGNPATIIDLKWGGESYRRQELQNGAAYQLASYSFLYGNRGQVPAVAYFILRSQRLLTCSQGLFPDVMPLEGASPDATWKAFEAAYTTRLEELKVGQIRAPGERDEAGALQPEESILENESLKLTPPCRFCQYSLLCGHGLALDPAAAPQK